MGTDVWGDRALTLPPDAPQEWRDVYTDAEIEARDGRLLIGEVLARLPAALLVSR